MIMFGLFITICTLVLAGLLVQRAAQAAADGAKGQVGSEVTLQWDMEKALSGGGFTGSLPDNAKLATTTADRLGQSDLASGYNYFLENATTLPGRKTASTIAPPAGLPADMRDDNMLPMHGVLNSPQLRDFRDGHFTVIAGRGVTAADRNKDVAMIEERLASANNLKAGDKVTLTAADGTNSRTFEIVGVYRNPAQSPKSWVSPQADPGNRIYVPIDAVGRLSPDEKLGDGMRIHEATYTLKDPSTLDQFRTQAAAAGLDLNVFALSVNDKQYQQLVGPIQNVASFAGVIVWLVGIAGAAVVSLLIALWMRERQREIGILLAMGERRWRLIGQQLAEILAVAAAALAAATILGASLSQRVADSLLGRELAAVVPVPTLAPGQSGGAPGPAVAPIDQLSVSLQSSDIIGVGVVGLIIALLAVTLPALRIVRMQPRSILAQE
jgi:putative ABC transport system permease protein